MRGARTFSHSATSLHSQPKTTVLSSDAFAFRWIGRVLCGCTCGEACPPAACTVERAAAVGLHAVPAVVHRSTSMRGVMACRPSPVCPLVPCNGRCRGRRALPSGGSGALVQSAHSDTHQCAVGLPVLEFVRTMSRAVGRLPVSSLRRRPLRLHRWGKAAQPARLLGRVCRAHPTVARAACIL